MATFNDGQCRTITLIEPDNTLLTGSSSGSTDPTLDESGIMPLDVGQLTVNVSFGTPKASEQYRFEYLYVDIIDSAVPPGFTIVPTVQIQTRYGFVVGLSGSPPNAGYVLKWRVIVISLQSLSGLDTPESIYSQLILGVGSHKVTFANPRSIDTYGFSELRVENLTDDLVDQTPIIAQVVEKTQTDFTVALSPSPPTNSYFLVARVP